MSSGFRNAYFDGHARVLRLTKYVIEKINKVKQNLMIEINRMGFYLEACVITVFVQLFVTSLGE